MAFVPSFSVSQTVVATQFTITDTSTGSDAAIVSRNIYLTTAQNTTLVPTGVTTPYIPFPLTLGASIVLPVLNVDYALLITVNWVNSSGATLYTSSQYYCFTANSMQFFFSLTTLQTSQPNIVQDTTYFSNKSLLLLQIDSANQAIALGNDIYKSQQCLDAAQYLINNQTWFF